MGNNELTLAFLGGIQIDLDGYDLTMTLPIKAQAILSYIVLSRRMLRRQEIGGLFWGNSTEERALASLRVALRRLNEQGLEPFLNPTRYHLAFRSQDANYQCDVEAFEQLMANANLENGRLNADLLRQGIDLYRGDFLHGFDAHDSPDFDVWMLAQRERLRQMALHGLDTLITHYIDNHQLNLGIEYAHRLLELDPWRESAHQQLMWLFANNGQRAAALTQYERCREILLNELNLEPDSETVALAEEIQSRYPTATRPFIPLPPVPNAEAQPQIPFLPPETTPYFVGRKRSLSRLAHLLLNSNGESRFCLTGMGGVGKTTLAIELAHQLRPHFADGVLWATAVSNGPMQIAETWANAYHYDFTGLTSLEARADALRALLVQKQALIIVDDVTIAAAIRPLLPENGRSVTLITSRQTDVGYRLRAREIVLSELTPQTSYDLLAKYIGEQRVEQEKAFALDICKMVGHLPLAIALIGGYLTYRPYRLLAQFVEQLQLEANRLPAEIVESGLWASLEISWQSLDDTQKRIFNTLALFAGRSFSLAAMAHILELDEFLAQDRLEDLVRFSLLKNDGRFRYRQHRLLADFSQEKLGEATEAYQRMVEYYVQFATENRSNYLAFADEWDNIDAVIAYAHASRDWEMVLVFTTVLHDVWFARGRYTEARQAFARAEVAAFALEDEPALAQNWLKWGQASLEQSDFGEAREKLTQSLTLYAELDDPHGVGDSQFMLARIALVQADYANAEQLLLDSQANAEKVDDSIRIAATYYQLARLANSLGNYGQALRICETAVSFYDTIDDKSGLIPMLRLYALILVNQGKNLAAKEIAETALQLAEQFHSRSERAVVLSNMVSIERNLGNIDLALQYASESLDLLTRMGDRRSAAVVIYRKMMTYQKNQQFAEALEAGATCLQMFREFADLRQIALTLTHMGNIYELMDNQTKALASWEEAKPLAEKLDHQVLQSHLQEKLGQKRV